MPKTIPYPPQGKNGQSSAYLYFQRAFYYDDPYENIFPAGTDIPVLMDTWNDKTLYGKVDTFGRYVFPDDDYLFSLRDGIEVMDFVADAYEEFVSFATLASTQIKTSMTSLIDVQNPKKGHFDVIDKYANYVPKLYDSFLNGFLSSKQRNDLKGFDMFMHHYLQYAEMNLDFPHTLGGYLASNRTPSNSSGLIIEFETQRYGNDNYKWQKFLRNDFFDDYLKIAAKFGFYVNRNIPWAIIANLGSEQMRGYMIDNNANSVEETFADKYLQAEYLSYLHFKKQMYNSYISFLTQQPLIEVVQIQNCPKDDILASKYKTFRIIQERESEFVWLPNVTYEKFEAIYSDVYFLKKYFDLRLLENKVFLLPPRYDVALQYLWERFSNNGLYEATVALASYLRGVSASHKNRLTLKEKRNNIKSKRKDIQPSGY